MLVTKLVNSLDKVLPAQEPESCEVELELVKNEVGSIQLAYKGNDLSKTHQLELKAKHAQLAVFTVGLVPVQNPAPADADDAYLALTPTLLPDILIPLGTSDSRLLTQFKAQHSGWNSLWIDITVTAGTTLTLIVDGEEVGTIPVQLRDVELPKANIVNTQWFHVDSLANYYDVEVWSDAHWQAIEHQIASAARMGVNCLLTPLWTSPLDTAIGTYRRTTQLLEITRTADGFNFGFKKARKWMQLLKKYGFTDVEVPHFFTQWGAASTPRFFITEPDGKLTPLFGWNESATSTAYRAFLEQLIPAVRTFLEAEVGLDHAWFHVSDEPDAEHLEAYHAAKAQVAKLLAGTQIIDALSEPQFQEVVDIPVVATNKVDGFRAVGVEPTWVYNCVAQDRLVANRFIAQRGTRHREIGFQLFKFNAKGILHWAFNFYNRQYSLGIIDPLKDTAAGGGFLSGDAFVVYPAAGGKVHESLRHRLLTQAINDLALCQLAAEKHGREAVLATIDPDQQLDYNSGFVDSRSLLQTRKRLLQLL